MQRNGPFDKLNQIRSLSLPKGRLTWGPFHSKERTFRQAQGPSQYKSTDLSTSSRTVPVQPQGPSQYKSTDLSTSSRTVPVQPQGPCFLAFDKLNLTACRRADLRLLFRTIQRSDFRSLSGFPNWV